MECVVTAQMFMLRGYVFLNLVLLVFLPFPFNYVSVAAGAFVIILLILRMFLERALNPRRATLGKTHFYWSIDKSLEDCRQLRKGENRKNGRE